MRGLIIEIQQSCLDDSVPVESLLRRVKLAATKLKLGSLENWVDSELNGYSEKPPPHRVIYGQPTAWNPMHGWIPVQTDSPTIADALSTVLLQRF